MFQSYDHLNVGLPTETSEWSFSTHFALSSNNGERRYQRLKFSIFIDRNGKGAPNNEFISLIFAARGPILVPKEAQGKKGSFHIFAYPLPHINPTNPRLSYIQLPSICAKIIQIGQRVPKL